MNWTRVDAIARELAATRAEVLGLAILLVGGVVLTWVVVQRPAMSGLAPQATAPAVSTPWVDPEVGPAPPPDGPSMQVVHVAGAVARPGVVHLEVGARVVDAIEAAGGMTNRAAADALNLAAAVADGDQVHVPTVRELAEAAASQVSPAGPTGPQPAATAAHLIDLNAATLAELEDLPGIGPVLAQRILEWRDANGAFVDVGQLREVSGIGESTFQDIAPLAHVG